MLTRPPFIGAFIELTDAKLHALIVATSGVPRTLVVFRRRWFQHGLSGAVL